MPLNITSKAFQQGQIIPKEYTCDGEDKSPPLEWKNVPENAGSLALISDDPDAPSGTWVHWVAYNIPVSRNNFEEDVPAVEKLEDGTTQGENDFRKIGYGGPCPPGGTHRYFFRIYALDKELNLDPGLTKKELLNKIQGHILDHGELMGKYSR